MKVLQMTSLIWLMSFLVVTQEAEGLAFVTAVVNPIATLRAVAKPITIFSGSNAAAATDMHAATSALQAHSSSSSSSSGGNGGVANNGKLTDEPIIAEFGHSDDTVQLQRSLIVDLVYEKSIERMNSFSAE